MGMNNAIKTVRIRVRGVGQSFGCVGQLVARNGRVIEETDMKPHGMTAAARDAALAIATKRGWEVTS